MLKRARILGKKLKKSKKIRRKILNLLELRKLGKLMQMMMIFKGLGNNIKYRRAWFKIKFRGMKKLRKSSLKFKYKLNKKIINNK